MTLLFTFELARSSLMNETSAPIRFLLRLAPALAEQVAANIIRVAMDSNLKKVTGRFFHKAKEIEAAAYAHDRQAQQRLWEISSKLKIK